MKEDKQIADGNPNKDDWWDRFEKSVDQINSREMQKREEDVSPLMDDSLDGLQEQVDDLMLAMKWVKGEIVHLDDENKERTRFDKMLYDKVEEAINHVENRNAQIADEMQKRGKRLRSLTKRINNLHKIIVDWGAHQENYHATRYQGFCKNENSIKDLWVFAGVLGIGYLFLLGLMIFVVVS